MQEEKFTEITNSLLSVGKMKYDDLKLVLTGLSDKDTEQILDYVMSNGFVIDEDYISAKLPDNLLDDNTKIYLNSIGSIPILSQEEEQFLFAEYKKRPTKQLRNKIVEHNLKLVIGVAKHYINTNMLFDDLIQNGNMGLLKAVDKFEYERGYKFSTYAIYWINQAISRALANDRTIRLPVHKGVEVSKVKKAIKQLEQELNRQPNVTELSEYLNMSEKRVIEVLQHMDNIISLDIPTNDEDPNTSIIDFVADDIDLEAQAINTDLKNTLLKVMDKLDPREIKVLKLRCGLDDGQPKTLEQVGKMFNVTRERIRQIEAKALRKLRTRKVKEQLEDYLTK